MPTIGLQLIAMVALVTATASGAAKTSCTELQATMGSGRESFPVPAGFIEICHRSEALCQVLTSGYPPSVEAFGYFVRPEE